MSAKSATNLRTLSPLPPKEVRALFGDPPLLQGEDIGHYNELMGQFAKIIEPKDMIEWWWVKDITDHTWEIRRLRRFKVLFVEVECERILEYPKRLAATLDEPMPMPDSETTLAQALMSRINQYKSVDTLIASAELRRAHILREIERHREYLARRLRKASDGIIDGEFAALPRAA